MLRWCLVGGALLSALLVETVHGTDDGSTFRVATAQFDGVSGDSPEATMLLNTAAYAPLAEEASEAGALIVVYPEFGLFGGSFGETCTTPTTPLGYCIPLPSNTPGWSGCDEDAHPILQSLCGTARNASIAMSVNLCEVDGASGTNFNTQVVLDSMGTAVAVYRKMHPWFTKCFADGNDYVTFNLTLPQGAPQEAVEFGVFTCKDILYSTPGPALVKEGIRHFVYSASIPIVGRGAEGGWALLHNSVLVASNLSNKQGGVWVGGKSVASSLPSSGSAIAIADVPIVQ